MKVKQGRKGGSCSPPPSPHTSLPPGVTEDGLSPGTTLTDALLWDFSLQNVRKKCWLVLCCFWDSGQPVHLPNSYLIKSLKERTFLS